MYNRKEYKYWVVLPNGKIHSAWEYREDALDALNDCKEFDIPAKIRSGAQFRKIVNRDSNWHVGGFENFLPKMANK